MYEAGAKGGIMKFRNELVDSTTDALILSVLNSGPAHGHEILRRINELSDGIFEWPDGKFYPALHKLEDQNLIQGIWVEGSNNKLRCVYTITAAGKMTLAEEANEWSAYSSAVAAILEASYA
jgi:PadR family transcriptional regulator, regulatory protein PadR